MSTDLILNNMPSQGLPTKLHDVTVTMNRFALGEKLAEASKALEQLNINGADAFMHKCVLQFWEEASGQAVPVLPTEEFGTHASSGVEEVVQTIRDLSNLARECFLPGLAENLGRLCGRLSQIAVKA